MMERKDVAAAIAESDRFVKRAKALLLALDIYESDLAIARSRSKLTEDYVPYPAHPRQSPVRRASLDLTEALARMRRGHR